MPSTLEKFGLAQAVKEMCERFQSTAALPITYIEEGELNAISKKRELMIFRIIQELINNALKHSHASQINVNFFGEEKNLTIIVEDNGIGFNVEEHKNDKRSGKGLGLYNIENRTRLVNADVEFNSATNRGSRIVLTIPYEKI